MTAKEAMQLIVNNQDQKALNYAVNYAQAGLLMDPNSEEFRVQCLYLVGNISNWRNSRIGTTPEQIKETRKVLKKTGGI